MRDPKVRAPPSGQDAANFSLATKARFTDRNGERQKRTEWHRIVAFGKLADHRDRCSKGRQLHVEGRLPIHQYEVQQEAAPATAPRCGAANAPPGSRPLRYERASTRKFTVTTKRPLGISTSRVKKEHLAISGLGESWKRSTLLCSRRESFFPSSLDAHRFTRPLVRKPDVTLKI